MLKTIREIGIFMIAAQAVIHFAPGSQYGKYIKSISSVIILLLFLKPFLQLAGRPWEEPEKVLEKMADLPELPAMQEPAGAGAVVAARMEEEIRALLNQELNQEPYYVKRVVVRIGEGEPFVQEAETFMQEAWQLSLEITLGKREEERLIRVEGITVGEAAKMEETGEEEAYRQRFAALLGIPEENVEVRMDGRG